MESTMVEERSKECILAIRKFQLDHGQQLSLKSTAYVNRRIEDAFEKDPTGSQVIRVIEELRELLTPKG